MAAGELVLQRYARALYGLASSAGVTEKIGADLDALAHNIAGHDDLPTQLSSPRLSRERKRRLLLSLLGERCHALARNTVLLLVDKGRAGQVADLAAAYAATAMAASGRVIAKVETAQPLDEAQRARLEQRLSLAVGKTVTVQEQVVAELLGGLRITVGSRRFDGSVSGRLARLRDRLLEAPLGASR